MYPGFLNILIKLSFFFFIEIILALLTTYYLFIFCAIYHESLGGIKGNYFIGIAISLATSIGLTIIISLMRYLNIKYKCIRLFNTSKFLYQHF